MNKNGDFPWIKWWFSIGETVSSPGRFSQASVCFAQVDLEGLESDFGSRALSFTDFRHAAAAVDFGGQMNPYAPCMEYLPTFALEITQM